jgi:NADH pyrophosphatase NudC (nudix superfamily)
MAGFLNLSISKYLNRVIVSRFNDFMVEKIDTIFDLPANAKFCVQCGRSVEQKPQAKKCPHCGWDMEGGKDSLVLICRNCNIAWTCPER